MWVRTVQFHDMYCFIWRHKAFAKYMHTITIYTSYECSVSPQPSDTRQNKNSKKQIVKLYVIWKSDNSTAGSLSKSSNDKITTNHISLLWYSFGGGELMFLCTRARMLICVWPIEIISIVSHIVHIRKRLLRSNGACSDLLVICGSHCMYRSVQSYLLYIIARTHRDWWQRKRKILVTRPNTTR